MSPVRILGLSDEERLAIEEATGIKTEGVQIIFDAMQRQTQIQTEQIVDSSVREIQEILGPHGSVTKLQAGGIQITRGTGVGVFMDGVLKTTIDERGNIFAGSNIKDPRTTTLCVFVEDQVYNSEQMGAGDLLFGDNTTGKSNVKYDASAGQLQFRYGSSIQAYMDTDGTLKAGGGDVTIDSNGIWFKNQQADLTFESTGGSINDILIYSDGSDNLVMKNQVGGIFWDVDSATAKVMELGLIEDSGTAELPKLYLYNTDASHENKGKIDLGNGELILLAGVAGENKFNGGRYDIDFVVYGQDPDYPILKTDAGLNRVEIGFDHYIPIRSASNPNIYFNEANQDMDFNIEGSTDADLVHVDAGTDRVGIGISAPSYKLEVDGDINIASGSNLRIGGDIVASREVLQADRTYYVRTDGSDSNDGLTDSSGGAFLTLAKANAVVATIDKNGYDITVQFGSGTWNETAILNEGAGDGTVTWKGTLTLAETATSATVAAGSGATHGTVTKTGQFTGDDHSGKLAYFVTDDEYRVIASTTSDALTVVGTAPSSTTQNVSVYSFGTVINYVQVVNGNTILQFIHFDENGNGFSVRVWANASVKIHECQCDEEIRFDNGTGLEIYYSYIYSSTGGALVSAAVGSYVNLGFCLIENNHTSSFNECFGNSFVFVWACVIDGDDGGGGKATRGFYAYRLGMIHCINISGDGYNKISNCDTGLQADSGGQVAGTSNNVYASNTADESATAASFGYID